MEIYCLFSTIKNMFSKFLQSTADVNLSTGVFFNGNESPQTPQGILLKNLV